MRKASSDPCDELSDLTKCWIGFLVVLVMVCLIVGIFQIALYAQDPNHYVQRTCYVVKRYRTIRTPSFNWYKIKFAVDSGSYFTVNRQARTPKQIAFYERILKRKQTPCFFGPNQQSINLHKIPPRKARDEKEMIAGIVLLSFSVGVVCVCICFDACAWCFDACKKSRRIQQQQREGAGEIALSFVDLPTMPRSSDGQGKEGEP